jgi:hypothetical protein
VLPFFLGGLRIGSLPPFDFAADGLQQQAFKLVDTLDEGQLVLVGIEYGPTGAAELDGAADALLRHILKQGARPVLLGSNPIGLLHASHILENIGVGADAPFLDALNRDASFQANQDYYIVRYLTGGPVGLRSLMQDMRESPRNPLFVRMLATDFRGGATNLSVRLPQDFVLVVVIAERRRPAGERVVAAVRRRSSL